MQKPTGRLIYKIVAKVAPLSGKALGSVIRFAHPNMAGKAFGAEVPSFRKPYFVAEFVRTSPRDDERAFAEMRRQGFAEFSKA